MRYAIEIMVTQVKGIRMEWGMLNYITYVAYRTEIVVSCAFVESWTQFWEPTAPSIHDLVFERKKKPTIQL
jgi:hypothetical protein